MSAPAVTRKPLVLLAEDDLISLKVTKILLEQAGNAVMTCQDGRDAVDHVAQGDYDLVLMDLRMPQMDGEEATRRIRALPDPHQAQVPIFALTGTLLPGDEERLLAVGFSGVLLKPLQWEAVASALEAFYQDIPTVASALVGYAWDHLPAVDYKHLGLLRNAMPADRLERLCGTARNSIADTAHTLEWHWANGHQQGAIDAAHRLAGVAANFGCSALAAFASRAETDFRQAVLAVPYFDQLKPLVAAALAGLSGASGA